ncbi:MAG TPA: methyltransferase [Bdellovibrionota bacterium]|nr:methyltransferase [Bdellovibrionota bacterium]
MSIDYSDGRAIESRILRLLKSAKRLDSLEAVSRDQYGEWAVRYHLCPERSNLIRHLDFTGLDVLELGAGMGALSRHVAENARFLAVVEGTQARFDALSERLRDLKNWRGVVANIQDAKLDGRKFDVVCVFGVLEYSELYIGPSAGETAFSQFLRIGRSHLKPDGALIVAIENRLGAKYWSGAAEDHTGHLFDGIVGYPATKSAKTFSRKELKALLAGIGLTAIDEYFPFPDYKIPSSVLSLEMIERAPGLSGDLATNQPYQNYGLPRFRCFPDSLAVPNVAEAGLLPEFSNSFLFVASAGETETRRKLQRRRLEDSELGWHYALSRRTPVRTAFLRGSQGIEIEKKPMASGENGRGEYRWTAPSRAQVATGAKLRTLLLRHAYFGSWEQFANELYSFLLWSLKIWHLSDGSIGGGALDATFINAAIGDPYELFDLEWSLENRMEASWFILRNVFLLVHDRDLLSASAPFASLRDLYEAACVKVGISPSFESDLEREASFLAHATNEPSKETHRAALLALFTERFGPSPYPRTPVASDGSVALSQLQAELQRLNRKLNQIHHRKIYQLANAVKRIPGMTKLVKSVLR